MNRALVWGAGIGGVGVALAVLLAGQNRPAAIAVAETATGQPAAQAIPAATTGQAAPAEKVVFTFENDEKMQEFEKCPFGILGLETALGLSLERLVHPGRITLGAMVALFTTGPARVLRLDRGTLATGAPADVTIFSPDLEWSYDVNQSCSKSRNSPFDGRTFRGGPVATIVSGAIVWRRG